MRMIEQRPDLFAAFVGTGQIVGMPGTQEALYQYALNHATAVHDEKMLAALKQLALRRTVLWNATDNFKIAAGIPSGRPMTLQGSIA